jgi:glycosyltransferase involved in cell wall biosynthesis
MVSGWVGDLSKKNCKTSMKRFPEYDIIMMALPRWDALYSSAAWSLAKALSRHTRVFYVDNPVSIKEYFLNRHTPEMKRRREALFLGSDFFVMPDENNPNLFAVTPRITLPVNWLPKGSLYNICSGWNDAGMEKTLNHLLRIFAIKKYVLVNSFNPLIGYDLSLKVSPALTIYQSVDDIRQAPYLHKHGPRLERDWIRKADFTLVTSTELKRTKSVHTSNVFLLPNAADAALFRQAVREDLAMPPEIRQLTIGKKIIAYLGNICQRLDYELLMKVANTHQDKILLMIGPFTKNDHGVSRLRAVGNVVFTGPKKINELPGFLKYSDCCIIPFLCNQLTKSIYPLKINEYLSAGKPVVTTRFSEDIAGFQPVVHIGNNHDEFITLISQSIETDTESLKIERMLFAASNTWEARAHSFIDLTVDFLKHDERRTGEPNRRKWPQTLYG